MLTKRSPARAAFAAALVASLAIPSPLARAQSENAAAAEVLFDDAKKLMAAGKYGAACAKFDASSRLDPGVGVLLYLGDCYEKNGQTASAWATFREAMSAARAAGQPAREKTATGRAAALEDKLVKLTIVVPPASVVPGLVIKRDGSKIEQSLWGSPLPVDPGIRTVDASAPGHKPWSTTVEAGKEPVVVVTLPGLEALPAAELSPAEATKAPASPVPAAPRPQPATGLGAQRTVAIVLGAAGVVGVGVGATFGAITMSNWSAVKSDPNCNQASGAKFVCAPGDVAAKNAAATASSSATVSDIGFIGGGVLLAGSLGLWLLAPRPKAPAPEIGFRSALSLEVGPRGGALTVHLPL